MGYKSTPDRPSLVWFCLDLSYSENSPPSTPIARDVRCQSTPLGPRVGTFSSQDAMTTDRPMNAHSLSFSGPRYRFMEFDVWPRS
jgi:hypothetical protein